MISSGKQEEYLSLITHGFPPNNNKSMKVIVVGAGMAVLVAAYELLKVGNDPLILEMHQGDMDSGNR